MPTYDYKCQRCGATAERHCPMLERHQQLCEECGAKLRLLITANACQICIPLALHTSRYDILPRSDKAKKTWKDEQVQPVGSRWV